MAMAMLGEMQQNITGAADAAMAAIMRRRTFGPILHFRERTADGKWSVCISAGSDEDSKVEIAVKTGNVAQQPGGFKLEGGANKKAFCFSNVTVQVQMQQQEIAVEYTCQFGEQEPELFSFVVPGASMEARTLYFSCNDTPMVSTREEEPELYNAWAFIRNGWMTPAVQEGTPEPQQQKQPPLHLMIGGGDQIYADEIFKKVMMDGDFQEGENYGLILDFYIAEYLRRFGTGDGNMAHALATVPSFMQCDDHEFYNGYGSYTSERRPHPNVGKAAQIARCAFQIGIPTVVEVKGNRATLENMTRVARTGPKTVMLNLDMRSNRDVEDNILMPMNIFDAKLAEAERLCTDGNTHHLMVLFASPVIWTHKEFSEIMAGVMKNVPVASIFATDALDMLQASNNIEQTTEMLHKLFTMAQRTKIRLLFVSGDVHNAGQGTLRAENMTNDNDFRYAQQWISSPIANLPDSTTGVALMKETLLGPQKKRFTFEADPTTGDKRGKLIGELNEVFDGTKNFLMISGEGNNLVGQLYINESDKSPKYLPIDHKWVSSPATVTDQGTEGGCCSVM